MNLKRIATGALLGLGGLAILTACSSGSGSAPTVPAAPVALVKHVAPVVQEVLPAPTSAAGYARAFAALPDSEYIASDLGITVPLGSVNGQVKTVWLFGDTFASHSFNHSTAIVQTGGRFHVSQGGRQVLPNDDARHIYWIESARSLGSGFLAVTARSVAITDPTNPWGFRDTGYARTARVSISPAGDLQFISWGAKFAEANDPGPIRSCSAVGGAPSSGTHLCYARHAHPELALANGHTLVTTAQNWTDGTAKHLNADGSVRWSDWSLIFSAS